MKKQILISFIVLLLFISAVSAQEFDNETNVAVSLDDNNPISEIEIENRDDNSDLTTSEIDDANLVTSSNPEKTNISQDSSFNTTQNHEILKANVDDDSNEVLREDPSNVIYVSPTGRGTGGSADDPTSWTTALTNLQDDTIIYFLDGVYEINSVIRNNNIILQALNTGAATIDAGRNNYALRILGNNATINGLNIINSFNSPAVYALDSIKIINSTFKNNDATSGTTTGAAVYSGKNITIINSKFENNTAIGSGGAVYSRGSVSAEDSEFIGNSAEGSGGAIYASAEVDVRNCEFKDNTADGSGGAIMADTISITESLFVNGTSKRGGGAAVYARTSTNISKSEFIDNTAHTNGGAVCSANANDIQDCTFTSNSASNGGAVYGSTNNIKNVNFTDNSAENMGGATYSFSQADIENCNFEKNNASRGGAVYSNQGLNINNSTFTENSANQYGGAAYANTNLQVSNSEFIKNTGNEGGAIYGKDVNVDSSEFRQNHADEYGGAIDSWGGQTTVNNSIFSQNDADIGGGAIMTHDLTASNSEFDRNQADRYGGAVYTVDGTVEDSNFTNNQADDAGGAIFADNLEIHNTNFINNNATNGGGFVSENANVENSRFIGNTAFDGAAMDCDNLTIDNSYFDSNSAKSYGIIYTVDATVKNSEFTNNHALDNTQIYALNSLELINTTIPDDEYTQANTTKDYIKNITDDRIIELESGLEGYCTQRTIYWTNGDVYVMDDLDILRNQITGEYIGEYLKILLYHFYENRTDLASVVWRFTDSDFRNSDNEYVKEVLRLYDSGFRVPTKGATLILKNNTQIVIDFFSAGKSSTQNLFLYNITYMGDNYNLTIEKIALNNTVKLGESSSFDIIVKNTGDTILNNVRVEEASYDDLKFLSWNSLNGMWNHILENNRHVFVLDKIYPNETFMFRVIFKTTSTGQKTNVVVVSSNETNKTNTTNKTNVVNPKMTIQKITLTPIVKLGQIVRFEIRVTNTGDVDLGDVTVIENNFNGLNYLGFTSKNGVWRHVIRNNKHVFVLQNPLKVNETMSFIVIFKTTKIGTFDNTVIGQSNETEPVTGKNSTKVITENKTDNKTKINKTEPKDKRKYRDEHATGNPLAILLCAISILVSERIYKRKR